MDTNTMLQNCLLSNFYNLITVQLDDSNYVTWKFLVETLLKGCGLMRYVDGSVPCPSERVIMEENGVASDIEKEYMNWVQIDSAIMSILASTLSSDALCFIIGSKSSKEMWCRLKEKYVDDSRYNIMNLKNSLYNIQKGSDSIDRYLLRVKSICDQLATMGVYMDDEDMVVSILHGLPSEFATIKAVIRIKTLSSPVSMRELRSLLLIAEDEIEQTVKSIYAPASIPLSPLAAMAAQNNLVNSSQKMQYGISNAGAPPNAFFPSPYVGNCFVSSTSHTTAPIIGLMPSLSISNGAVNGAFNGTRQLQSQVHNVAYGDGYFQHNGGFSQQQSSGGFQQNNALQSIGNLSYSGSKSQGQAQHDVKFSKGCSKSKGGVSQHNVSSYHKSRNSNSGDGFYMHILPILVPPEKPVAHVSIPQQNDKSEPSSSIMGATATTPGEILVGTGFEKMKDELGVNVILAAKTGNEGTMKRYEELEVSSILNTTNGPATIDSVINSRKGNISKGDDFHIVSSSDQMKHFTSLSGSMRPMVRVKQVEQQLIESQMDLANTGNLVSQAMELQKVKIMMNCRRACQSMELWPSLPLLHPG
ncbi:uncharacterized protein LOC133723077 isoform X1 [Rosa rugosa]|uniref:uncharacterized protein LOC133723077 isoform X1 n=1 Tax=Rosa rugosa TaxID=74645 RepID=UPI002B414613|nr:uncharacterized protein LOC133723077 isoform X1 [Rosa rugosa]XP_062005899.1 uncharacterized protein LOC133723077 isoform X1 [Rosa rugosa]XP_062005904.1 uncharacterized protein LOC133723077 isoform X1 [Rosa rugosa]XP_062005909.1 uncharacterized protein LOC133723077 isoform X1 [Rosa rugosa]